MLVLVLLYFVKYIQYLVIKILQLELFFSCLQRRNHGAFDLSTFDYDEWGILLVPFLGFFFQEEIAFDQGSSFGKRERLVLGLDRSLHDALYHDLELGLLQVVSLFVLILQLGHSTWLKLFCEQGGRESNLFL